MVRELFNINYKHSSIGCKWQIRVKVDISKLSLPGARFLEECGGKQGTARGDLSGSVGSSVLKPPGDGFHKHRGHEVWHELI